MTPEPSTMRENLDVFGFELAPADVETIDAPDGACAETVLVDVHERYSTACESGIVAT